MIKCAREDCDVVYEPKTHNQKYHDSECCRIATNRRIMNKYYARRAQRLGHERFCESCGNTRLSRYNDSQICGACAVQKQEESRKAVVSMFAAVDWQ